MKHKGRDSRSRNVDTFSVTFPDEPWIPRALRGRRIRKVILRDDGIIAYKGRPLPEAASRCAYKAYTEQLARTA